jgi:BirA family biotin operon repressor/biotin-[acetyl-CoA-carboxylase] ligase
MLSASVIREAAAGSMWTSVTVVPSTGSTNADLLAAGGPEGQVLAAEEQTAGRGRLGRAWVSEPGAALTFSVLLRPSPASASRPGRAQESGWPPLPPERLGWLPLLAGIAVAAGIGAVAGLPARLKWPNDVLVRGRKVAGILAEQSVTAGAPPPRDSPAVVIGAGINVATRPEALPSGPGGLRATSLAAEGAAVARERLLIAILRELESRYCRFRASPDPSASGLLAEYERSSDTLGRMVRAELPGGRVLSGEASGIAADGSLLVAAGGVTTAVSAGDVVHLR